MPFLSFIATEMHDSAHKRARVKLVLFLQGSTFYDLTALREQLEPRSNYLPVEIAILESRVRLCHASSFRVPQLIPCSYFNIDRHL